MNLPPVLTSEDVQELLGIERSTLYTYVKSERLPHVQLRGKRVFLTESVVGWLRERERQGVPVVAREQPMAGAFRGERRIPPPPRGERLAAL